MKKAAILSITAFYLLLTTGMFVCAVHCTAEKLFAKPAMQMAGMQQDKHCMGGKDCDCCKKHGIYLIKENIKPGYTIQFTQTAVTIPPIQIADFLLNTRFHYNKPWEYSNAPPGIPGKTISIRFHSLLI